MTTVHEATPDQPVPEEPKRKGKKKAKPAEVPATDAGATEQPEPETNTTEPTTTEPSEPKPTKSKQSKRPAKGPMGNMTLRQLSDFYIAHLETTKSPGTSISYKMELDRACDYLGADTLIGSITPDDVARFNTSTLVMRKKDGSPKAQPSFLKTRRVLRLCLVWAANDRKWLESAPIPVEAAESK